MAIQHIIFLTFNYQGHTRPKLGILGKITVIYHILIFLSLFSLSQQVLPTFALSKEESLQLYVLYDPAIIRLVIYPKELKTYVHTQTSKWMFWAVLLIVVKTWNKPVCFNRWMDKLWYIQTMECYSVLKREMMY